MPVQTMGSTFDPGAGRLPAPMIGRPLSSRQFHRLAASLRKRGAWTSLWNSEGQWVDDDPGAGALWNMWRGSDNRPQNNKMLDALTQCARRVLQETEVEQKPGLSEWVPFAPCPQVFKVASIPVRLRQRCIGVVLAIELVPGSPSEDLHRFCDASSLDFEVVQRARAQHELQCNFDESAAGLIALAVEQARDIDHSDTEIRSLTNNLESTYEELHLIYEISRLMGIPQQPAQMLERVSRELLEVSRAAGIAFVLNRSGSSGGGAGGKLGESKRSSQMPVVQVGNGAPTLDELSRLDSTIPIAQKLEADHVVCNRAFTKPEYEWAASWLQHFVVVPLRLDGELLGTFYAINVIDEADFSSVDIQLLKAVADRISAALKNQNLYDDLADLLMGLMHALVNSVDAKDPYTFGHSQRVAFYSRSIAQASGLSQIECERIYLAGLLHDVGKIGVPDAILTKPGKLTADEFDALKKHPEIGERILSQIRQLRDLMPGVLHHHERMDGRGYPHGLAGRDIPLLGRIICLADSFDAMTSNRTYRAALPIVAATAEIRRCAGNQFDPELAEVFLKIGPEKLFEEAKQSTKGNSELARIGAFCTALSARPKPAAMSKKA